MEGKSVSIDIFGLSHFSEAAADLAKRALGPLSDEVGRVLAAKFRITNFAQILDAASRTAPEGENINVHPRVFNLVLNTGTWVDDTVLQTWWGSLLAASMTTGNPSDHNMIYATLLSQMTGTGARIIEYACKKAPKQVSPSGFLTVAQSFWATEDKLRERTGTDDRFRLDQEIAHLQVLGLLVNPPLRNGFLPTMPYESPVAMITPTPRAFYLYVLCHGSTLSPVEFFGHSPVVQRMKVQTSQDAHPPINN